VLSRRFRERWELSRGLDAQQFVEREGATELDELVSLCDRVLIMFRGAIVGELSGEAIERRAILQASTTGQIQAAA